MRLVSIFRRPWTRRVAALLCLALAAGCERPHEDAGADAASELSTSAATPPPGRHALTGVPPVETTDVERMLGQGFTTDEVLAAIRQRGVLRAPDSLESAYIAGLPGGARLAEAMALPENVVIPGAAAARGRYLNVGFNPEPRPGTANPGRATAMPSPTYQAASYQGTAQADRARRRQELGARLAKLRMQYAEQTRRGETGAIVSMEIARLQRELAALP